MFPPHSVLTAVETFVLKREVLDVLRAGGDGRTGGEDGLECFELKEEQIV